MTREGEGGRRRVKRERERLVGNDISFGYQVRAISAASANPHVELVLLVPYR